MHIHHLLAKGFWRYLAICAGCLLAIAVLGVLSALIKPPITRARAGVLDLSNWSSAEHGPAPLKGEWELYWDRLVSPQDFHRPGVPLPTRFVRLPSAWNHFAASAHPQSHGVATYRLRLEQLSSPADPALWIPEQAAAYRIWVNGNLVASNGSVARARRSPDPVPSARLVRLDLPAHSAELVLQVANYHTFSGGAVRALEIGSYAEFELRWWRLRYCDAVLFGSLSVMALYQIGHYLLRRRDHAALYAALASLSFAFRIPVFGFSGRPLSDIVPNLPWEVPERLQPALSLEAIGFMCLYALCLLPRSTTHRVVRGLGVMDIVGGLFVLVIPKAISSFAFPLVFAADLFLFLLLLSEIRVAIRRKSSDGVRLLASWLVMAPTGLAEILINVASGTGTHVPLMPVAAFLFMLLHSWRAAAQIQSAYASVELLSNELERKNSQLLRIEALKDEFLASATHELRAPLRAVVGLGESLLEGVSGDLPTSARERLILIVTSGRRLASLTSDVLDLSKLRRGDVHLSMQAVDLRTLCSAAIAHVMVESKRVAFVNEVPKHLPLLAADETRLLQAIRHLVDYAVRTTRSGRVCLTAWVSEKRLILELGDARFLPTTARGSSPSPGADRLVLQPSSTDFGLHIAQYIISLHAGSVERHESAGGRRFSVTLPLSSAAVEPLPSLETRERAPVCSLEEDAGRIDTPIEARSAHAPEELRPLNGAKLLVVDDDPVNVRLVEDQLRLAGASITATVSGEEALAIIQSESFDLVLLDVMMPRVTGFEICQVLRSRLSRVELPILLLTARADPSDLTLYFDVGANDYLFKPFTRIELLTRCRTQIELKRSFAAATQKAALERELERQRYQTEAADLRAARAELERLRYQVNPHLLFNSLTSIRGAMSRTPQIAREMISMLADYYRLTLAFGARNVIPFAEELRLTECYLSIELARQQNTRTIAWEVDRRVHGFMVPALLLQPLVENALKYRLDESEDSGDLLRVSAKPHAAGLSLRVSNAGEWVQEVQSRMGLPPVGLDNVRQRLVLYYGHEAKVLKWSAAGWVHVELLLPRPAIDIQSTQRSGAMQLEAPQ